MMNARQQMESICTCMCRINELYSEWAKRHGMSSHVMITIYALDQNRTSTQTQIAQEWMIPKQTVNTVIKDLERRGYVRFEAGRDLKEKRVCFTESGKAFAEETLRDLYEKEERAMTAMGQELAQVLVEANQAFTQQFANEVLRES